MKFLSIIFITSQAYFAHAFPKPMPLPQGFDFDAIQALPPPPKFTMSTGVTARVVKINTAAIIKSAVQAVTTDPIIDPARKIKRQVTSDSPSVPSAATPSISSCVGGNAQPTGAGVPTTPDTPSAFLDNPVYSNDALSAATPSGYQRVFQNLKGSTSLYYYMGYNTLPKYDTTSCANMCNSIALCQSFNIYFERDPSVDPDSGTGCSNPPSTTVIK